MQTVTPTERLARAPRLVRRWALYFETEIEAAVQQFAQALPDSALLLDIGAGGGQHRRYFHRQRYIGLDLQTQDVIAEATKLPIQDNTFLAAISIVTLEHIAEPTRALREAARVLKPGSPILLVTPFDWEEHQQPRDFFRYTRFGLRHLLDHAGFEVVTLTPVGGYFRLLSRRLLSGLQFFMRGAWWLLFPPVALVFVPLSLVMPLFEPLDRERNFTLGYICTARKRS